MIENETGIKPILDIPPFTEGTKKIVPFELTNLFD